MKKQFSIRVKIFISLSFILVNLIGGYVLQSFFFARTIEHYNHIVNVNLHKAESLALMRSYAKDIVLSLALLGHPDNPKTEVDRLHAKFDDYIAQYDKEREKYAKLPSETEEQREWTDVDQKWQKNVSRLKEIRATLTQPTPAVLAKARASLVAEQPVRNDYYKAIEELTRGQSAKSESIAKAAEAESAHNSSIMNWFMLVSGSLVLLIATLLYRSISMNLGRIAEHLTSGATELSSAANQICSASQVLSSASKDQAASIEQTSSSLEELTGIVQNNLRSAEHSAQLSDSVCNAAEQGEKTMETLVGSMNDILESNNKIDQLVRLIEEIAEKTEVIDEIVFQTKLLSFNASVEAERAGEHGRGFSVVAQEVGNLAQLSGKAALEISSIVKGSIKNAEDITSQSRKKVEAGHTIVQNTAQVLAQVKRHAQETASSTRQIFEASKEQALGLKQISAAMNSLSRTTQDTSTSADQTAASGEELNYQADSLKELTQQLKIIVTGTSEDAFAAPRSFAKKFKKPSARVHAFPARPAPAAPLKMAAGDDVRPSTTESSSGSATDDWENL